MKKYEFIKELLENKKINTNQRERIIELAAKEIGSNGTMEERIQEIEKIIFNDKPAPHLYKKSHSLKGANISDLPEYNDPSGLYTFLFEYNQNIVLKSTCHDIDSDGIKVINNYCNTEQYDYQKHLNKIINAYEIHEKKYFAPHTVKALIRGYLTGKGYKGNELKGGWSSDKIKVNWSHFDIISWVEKNPHLPPNLNEEILGNKEILGFEFEQINSKISGKTIQNFTDLVLHFKHLFHIRHDNSLRDILERINRSEKWYEKIDFDIIESDFPRNIEYFTDVDKLLQSYKKIIMLIIERNTHAHVEENAKVKLSFTEKENSVEFSIHHLNSIYGKTIKNTLERTGQTYNSLIKKQINGLCDLYLKANFGLEEFAQINLWNGEERKEIKIDRFEGVEHVLAFPKNRMT